MFTTWEAGQAECWQEMCPLAIANSWEEQAGFILTPHPSRPPPTPIPDTSVRTTRQDPPTTPPLPRPRRGHLYFQLSISPDSRPDLSLSDSSSMQRSQRYSSTGRNDKFCGQRDGRDGRSLLYSKGPMKVYKGLGGLGHLSHHLTRIDDQRVDRGVDLSSKPFEQANPQLPPVSHGDVPPSNKSRNTRAAGPREVAW